MGVGVENPEGAHPSETAAPWAEARFSQSLRGAPPAVSSSPAAARVAATSERASATSQAGNADRLVVAADTCIGVQPDPKLEGHSEGAEVHRGEVVRRAAVHRTRPLSIEGSPPSTLPQPGMAKSARHVSVRMPPWRWSLAVVLKAAIRPLAVQTRSDHQPVMDQVGKLLGPVRPSHASRDRRVLTGTPILDRVAIPRAGNAGSDTTSSPAPMLGRNGLRTSTRCSEPARSTASSPSATSARCSCAWPTAGLSAVSTSCSRRPSPSRPASSRSPMLA